MTEEIILRYSTSTTNYTPRTVADEFARCFFDRPRYVRKFNAENNKFSLVGGVSVYQVRLVVGVRLESDDRYDVVHLVNSSSVE